MTRFATMVVVVAGALVLFVEDAFAMHDLGHRAASSSSGFAWDTFGLWTGIGVAIVLVVAWLAFEGRRHHWHPPHRPVHTH